MKKLLFLCVASLFFISCTSEYESNLKEMGNTLTEEYYDNIFKLNATVEVFEIIAPKYEVITKSKFDSICIEKYIGIMEENLKLQKEQLEQIKKSFHKSELYRNLNWNDLKNFALDDMNEANEKVKKYGQVVRTYSKKADSLENLLKVHDKSIVYEFSGTIKYKIKDNETGESFSTIDNMKFYFNKDLILLNMDNQ